ncbi:MAG TPA: helix-turn-helix domain-containing protein [Gemmatimonadaceae bacterium]|nr:helix-turn-helix domain-containing protein [Gemmatimonadaceae bacterium]
MEYTELAPPAILSDVVHRIWTLRASGGDSQSEPVVPDGHSELIVHLGEPFSEVDAAGAAHRQASVLVSGQLTGPLRLAPSAEADVIGIRFHPGSARAVLGVDMHELTDRVVPLADVSRSLACSLEDAARRSADSAGRLHAVTAVLVAARRRRGSPVVVEQAASMLADSGLAIRTIARLLGTTPRTLERRFHSEVGMSPKVFQSILRFRGAFSLLERTPRGRWAGVAAACGYYDQAHMIREFRRFAGESPLSFFRPRPQLASAFMGAAGSHDA